MTVQNTKMLWRRLLCALGFHMWTWADHEDVRAGLACQHCQKNVHSFI